MISGGEFYLHMEARHTKIGVDEFFEILKPLCKMRSHGEIPFDVAKDIFNLSWDLSDKRRVMYEAMSDKPMKIPGIPLFYPLGEAKQYINNDDLMDSWVYDRKTGIVILNIHRGSHEAFMADLYSCHTGADLSEWETLAEKFLTEGLGFSFSSRATIPSKGKNVRLTPQERAVFGTEFINI